jgi:CheY-like chemotaxis protein/MinD-like ATPase involved in chromosome partitioning or flagellar assembly
MANILVIDDDLDLQQMLRLMLQRGGHKVITTGDGSDGLAKAKQLRPDLAIVDVMMPGMNGFQVVRQMRNDPDTANTAILVLTARAQAVDREAALAAHADDYMAKPVSPNELLTKVNELLALRTQAQGPAQETIALLSLRGGVGVTSIAVNVALAWQAKGRTTCLVDLKAGPGHVALQLRLNTKSTWIDWANSGATTIDSIAPHVLTHESGLSVLAAPIIPVGLPNPDRITQLIGLLRTKYERVVIDTPPVWDASTAAIAAASDLIWLIVAPEVGSLQSTVGALRAFKAAKIPDEHVQLIANQPMPKAGLALPAIEKALALGFKSSLPYDEAQSNAIGQGLPLVISQPASPLTIAFRQLVL